MDKEKLRQMIPYVVLVVAIAFTLWSVVQVQNTENICNEHLKDQYKELIEKVEEVCPIIKGQDFEPDYLVNVTLEPLG